MPWFEGSRGRIHHDTWLPDGDVRSVLVFLHGFGEHLGLYDVFARRLTADGHAVHALDCAGHGRSDGERGLMTWDAYAEDALTLVRVAAEQHPEAPITLAGHSGGRARCVPRGAAPPRAWSTPWCSAPARCDRSSGRTRRWPPTATRPRTRGSTPPRC